MTAVLYLAFVCERNPVTGELGPGEQWDDADFGRLCARITNYNSVVRFLNVIDFKKGTVTSFIDPESAVEAYMRGLDYEETSAGYYDMRTEIVFPRAA